MIFKQIKNNILDIIFPIHCLNCGAETTGKKKNKWLCTNCIKKFIPHTGFYCPGCDARSITGKFCINCRRYYLLDRLLYPFSYKDKKIEAIVKAFKYRFIKDLDRQIVYLLNKYLEKISAKGDEFNFNHYLITTVPLTKRRLNWRGFNQTELIAQGIYEFLKSHYEGLEFNPHILKRIKHTTPQTELKGEQRFQNVKNIFEYINKQNAVGRKILLIDDVYTTGATMNECARILKEAGAEEVAGLVFAKG